MIDQSQAKKIQDVKYTTIGGQIALNDRSIRGNQVMREITNRPLTGTDPLVATVSGGAVPRINSNAVIQRSIGAIGSIEFTDPVGTIGTSQITVAGVPITSVGFSYVAADSANAAANAALAAIDTPGYSGSVVGNILYITGLDTDNGNILDLLLVIGALPGYTPTGMLGGGVFNDSIVYDFPNEATYIESDSAGNRWSSLTDFIRLSNNPNVAAENDFSQDRGTDWSNFWGSARQNRHTGGAMLDFGASGSNIKYDFNHLTCGARLNLYFFQAGETFEKNFLSGPVTLTPLSRQTNLVVTTFISNYRNDYNIPLTLDIDFELGIFGNYKWTGEFSVGTNNNLKTILGLASAPTHFRIAPKPANTFIVEHATGNIKVEGGANATLVGAKGDFVECWHDGVNVWAKVYNF